MGKLVFLFVMMCFIGIQWKMSPFDSVIVNRAEFILLSAIPIMIMAQMPALEHLLFVSVVRSFLVLLPVPLITWYCLRVITMAHKQWVKEREEVMQFHVDDQMQVEYAQYVEHAQSLGQNYPNGDGFAMADSNGIGGADRASFEVQNSSSVKSVGGRRTTEGNALSVTKGAQSLNVERP